jgi:hypothetical protein
MKGLLKLTIEMAAITILSIMPAGAVQAAAVSVAPASVTFRVVPTPNDNFNNGLLAASASSPNDIWAVGQSTIHFDGTKWTAFPAAKIAGNNTSFLGGVADISPTQAWAVGTVNIGLKNPGQVIEQWNGTAWSLFPIRPFAPGDQPNLRSMTAISADDIWAIGSLLSDDGQKLSFLFEHWNGTSWTVSSLRSGDAFLLAVAADATNDVWAVGFEGPENDDSGTLVLHYNGSTWESLPSPNVGRGANQLNAVAALSPSDVWAVGFSTPVAPPQEAATLNLIEHYDGTSWSVIPSPNRGPTSIFESNRLLGVTAISANNVWAYGSYFAADGSGHQKTLLMNWNGSTWSIVPSPNPTRHGFLSDLLFAGVSPAANDFWIFGAEDESPHDGTLAIHSTNAGN